MRFREAVSTTLEEGFYVDTIEYGYVTSNDRSATLEVALGINSPDYQDEDECWELCTSFKYTFKSRGYAQRILREEIDKHNRALRIREFFEDLEYV